MTLTAQQHGHEQALLKVLPLLCRADTAEGSHTLRAVGGGEITPEVRDVLLAKCAANEYVEVDLSVLAYEQRPGKPNRNYVRFADKAMKRLGASGRDTPFLRDHAQSDLLARGGTVTESATEQRGEGDYAIRQTTRLTAPWAVDLALRNLLGKVSIGWWPTGPIECSVCGSAIFAKCYHWPGDRVSESIGVDGVKQYLRDPNGKLTVEWVYTSADLIETSALNVPGVPNAGIEDVRAALSASFPDYANGDGVMRPSPAPLPIPPTAATRCAQDPEEPTMPNETEMLAEIEKLKAQTATAEAEKKAALASIDGEVEKRSAEREKRVAEAKALAAELGLDPDDVEKAGRLAAQLKSSADVKDELLKLKIEQQKKIAILATQPSQSHPQSMPSITMGMASGDKLIAAMGEALTYRTLRPIDPRRLQAWQTKLAKEGKSSEIPKPPTEEIVKRMARMRLVDLAEQFLEARGVRTLGMSPGQIAELALTIGNHTLVAGSGGSLQGTVDFPGLLSNTANKLLQIGYSESPSPWRELARRVDRPDFKEFQIVRRSGAPRLSKITERGEIKSAGYNEATPLVGQLASAGVTVGFTRHMIINDDMDAFSETALGLGDSAVAYEDDIAVLDILYGNPTLEDGTTLFHSSRGNISTDAGTPDLAAIKVAARMFAAMGETVQKADSNVGTTTRKTQFSLVGFYGAIAEMMEIDSIIDTPRFPDAPANAVPRTLQSIKTLRDDRLQIESASPDVHFAFSNRAALVYGGLEGDPSPRLSMSYTANVDGVTWGLVHDTYVAVAEPKAIIRIPKS